MSKAFASQADLADKKVTFTKLSDNAYAYTAEGDPNTGVVVGDDAVMVIDTQATPVMAQDVIRHIREVTDKPIKYVVMSHYHAVRVLGASAYGASEIIASEDTRDLIVERGAADMKSEIERFPRLFRAVETIPGLTWPTLTFKGEMTVWLGKLEVRLMQLGRGHTKGDTVAWLPQQKILLQRRPGRVRRDRLRRRRLLQRLAADARQGRGARRRRRSSPAAAPRSPTRRCAATASRRRAPSSATCSRASSRASPRATT